VKETGTVQSVTRGLEILERAAAAESGLTLAELAAALGVSRPTAFNLAKTLVVRGYLEKVSRPVHYRLGPAIDALARRRQERNWRAVAETEVLRLARLMPGTFAFVAEPVGGEIEVTLRVDPARPGTLERPGGRMLVPYTMALTLCFQAFWSVSDRASYEARYPFDEYGRGVWGDEATLEAFLGECRRVGYVERGAPGPYRLAVPVSGADGRVLAVIGVSRQHESAKEQARVSRALIKELQSAARTISGAT